METPIKDNVEVLHDLLKEGEKIRIKKLAPMQKEIMRILIEIKAVNVGGNHKNPVYTWNDEVPVTPGLMKKVKNRYEKYLERKRETNAQRRARKKLSGTQTEETPAPAVRKTPGAPTPTSNTGGLPLPKGAEDHAVGYADLKSYPDRALWDELVSRGWAIVDGTLSLPK